MQILKSSAKKAPKVSLILLDWSVRESFHICHYLQHQTVSPDAFEVVLIEYYGAISDAVRHFQNQMDVIAVLELPQGNYYHKHLMYNIGFALSRGEIIVICDSDAMVKPTFIETIIRTFDQNPNIVLHLDEFRNNRKDFYPFNYPSFEDVIGCGCINYVNGMTTGLASDEDVIHLRNYGACFCCRRQDYLAIGGADEHVDYVGHICGPYDLTFRLINLGREEVWHSTEFLYHTWHPGTDGIGNYLGPHDGRNVSTTSLHHILSGATLPHVQNPLISFLQQGKTLDLQRVSEQGVSPRIHQITSENFLANQIQVKAWAQNSYAPGWAQRLDLVDERGNNVFVEVAPVLPIGVSLFRRGLFALVRLYSQFKMQMFYYAYILKLLIIDEIRRVRERYLASEIKRTRSYLRLFFRVVRRLLTNPLGVLRKAKKIRGRFREILQFSKFFPNFRLLMQRAAALNRGAILIVHNKMQAAYIRTRCCDRASPSFKSEKKGAFLEVVAVEDWTAPLRFTDEVDYYFTESAYAKFCQTKSVDVESATV